MYEEFEAVDRGKMLAWLIPIDRVQDHRALQL